MYVSYMYSFGQALPLKASNYAREILAFTGGGWRGEYSTFKREYYQPAICFVVSVQANPVKYVYVPTNVYIFL